MNKKNAPISNMGTISLVMIFMVLCLVIFSILSLSGSLSDFNMSKEAANKSKDYYQAEIEVTKTLKKIDEACEKSLATGSALSLETLEGNVTTQEDSDAVTLLITEKINDKLHLEVTLTMNETGHDEDGFYTITSWKEVPSNTWTEDDTYKLM